MKRELLIKELKRVREELVNRGYFNYGINEDSDVDMHFRGLLLELMKNDTNRLNYTETDITLAEFLGWEEDVEYKYDGNRFYIFKDKDQLFYWNAYRKDWLSADASSINRLRELRNAKKVEKRYIVPLPNLKTSDGEQQYLTRADNTFFASRQNEDLRQTWKEEHLKYIPEEYRKYAVELKGAE